MGIFCCWFFITIEEKTNLITKIKAVIVRITGIESEYYKEVERVLEKTTITLGIKLRNVIGILNALKNIRSLIVVWTEIELL